MKRCKFNVSREISLQAHKEEYWKRLLLTLEDRKSLLETLDLLVAARLALFVRHPGVDARRLELLKVPVRRVHFLLRRLQVAALLRRRLLRLRAELLFPLNIRQTRGGIHLVFRDHVLEGLLRLRLAG